MFVRVLVAVLLVGSASGCASVLKDKTQPVKVEAINAAGESVAGAKCVLRNDRGEFNVETPNTVFVRKSAGELMVTCVEPEHGHADGKLLSRVGGAVFGNILLGGGIGAIVDTASGVAFNYPEWVQLVFGQSLTFDRNDFKEAQPTVAKAPETSDAPAVAGSPATEDVSAAPTPADQPAPEPVVERITLQPATEKVGPTI